MRAFEGQALRRCDRVIAVSARDAKGLAEQYRLPVVDLVDTGVDLDFYGYHAPDEQTNTVVFSGAMDSRSNIDGISFLMEEVWPHLMALRPDARMIVAGRNPPQALVEKARARRLNWEFTGYVDDIRAPVLAGSVSVIPLRVGSGTRLKAFEAVALGRPIVSTTIGVEGLPLEPGRHCLIADDGPAFAQALARLLEDREERVRIARAARDLLEERFSWAHIGKQFEGICLRAIGR
jgi:glycosyltransferase involved in cell wall biosynthesis